MRTSAKDDTDFIKEILPSSLLEDAISFITNTYSAEELYGVKYMRIWAEENGYTDEE
jgi:hypothetical protein